MPEFLGWCQDSGVQVVTLYLLSSDNLTGRDPAELGELFGIIADLAELLAEQPGWRIQHVGSGNDLPESLCSALRGAEQRTQGNSGLHVNLAVGYGGRSEITAAMHSLIEQHKREGGTLDTLAERLTAEQIGANLWTRGQPDPDLVIRTSGEQRLSDFMIWQSAHSEFYFVDALYPDLREIDLLRALRDYSRRNRRYGS